MNPAPSRRTLGGVPVLLAAPPAGEAPPPIALWFHGFRAAADGNEAELVRLAAAGFLAVGVDAVGHGARAEPGLDARVAASPGGALPIMLALAHATAVELPALVRAIGDARLGDAGRVGVIGVSMGGYLAYRAPLVLPGLRAVAAVLGSPEWDDDASPHRRPEAFHAPALLSVTAERDVNVPPAAARRFHAALSGTHPAPERLRYLELPDAEHLMTGEQWAAAMDASVEWLVRHVRHVR